MGSGVCPWGNQRHRETQRLYGTSSIICRSSIKDNSPIIMSLKSAS